MENGLSKKFGPYIAVVVVILALSYAFYANAQLTAFKQNPQKIAQDEVKDLVAKVGKLYVLPTGEDPTVATVTKPELLKDQPFFAKAQTGYKVLIYSAAKKAILYDPASDKIVEVAPINIGPNQKVTPVAPKK